MVTFVGDQVRRLLESPIPDERLQAGEVTAKPVSSIRARHDGFQEFEGSVDSAWIWHGFVVCLSAGSYGLVELERVGWGLSKLLGGLFGAFFVPGVGRVEGGAEGGVLGGGLVSKDLALWRWT